MKTLYFDCFAGASGDMILGALVAAGVEPRALTEQAAESWRERIEESIARLTTEVAAAAGEQG